MLPDLELAVVGIVGAVLGQPELVLAQDAGHIDFVAAGVEGLIHQAPIGIEHRGVSGGGDLIHESLGILGELLAGFGFGHAVELLGGPVPRGELVVHGHGQGDLALVGLQLTDDPVGFRLCLIFSACLRPEVDPHIHTGSVCVLDVLQGIAVQVLIERVTSGVADADDGKVHAVLLYFIPVDVVLPVGDIHAKQHLIVRGLVFAGVGVLDSVDGGSLGGKAGLGAQKQRSQQKTCDNQYSFSANHNDSIRAQTPMLPYFTDITIVTSNKYYVNQFE